MPDIDHILPDPDDPESFLRHLPKHDAYIQILLQNGYQQSQLGPGSKVFHFEKMWPLVQPVEEFDNLRVIMDDFRGNGNLMVTVQLFSPPSAYHTMKHWQFEHVFHSKNEIVPRVVRLFEEDYARYLRQPVTSDLDVDEVIDLITYSGLDKAMKTLQARFHSLDESTDLDDPERYIRELPPVIDSILAANGFSSGTRWATLPRTLLNGIEPPLTRFDELCIQTDQAKRQVADGTLHNQFIFRYMIIGDMNGFISEFWFAGDNDVKLRQTVERVVHSAIALQDAALRLPQEDALEWKNAFLKLPEYAALEEQATGGSNPGFRWKGQESVDDPDFDPREVKRLSEPVDLNVVYNLLRDNGFNPTFPQVNTVFGDNQTRRWLIFATGNPAAIKRLLINNRIHGGNPRWNTVMRNDMSATILEFPEETAFMP